MVKKSFADMHCSLAQALNVIGEWWSMLIVRDFFLGNGTRRFEQLRDSLGISRNILTERLKTLTDAGVIERVPLQEGGKRCAYQLTEKGRDLMPIMIAMLQWGDKWQQLPGQRFLNVRDRKREEEIAPLTVQSSHGEPLMMNDLYLTAITAAGEMPIRQWPLESGSAPADAPADNLEQAS
ncbi:MAG: helix-turn-helix domain-containing protein [Halieaceae bacterium]